MPPSPSDPLVFRKRDRTELIVIHDSHTPPPFSHLKHFLLVKGRTMGLLEIGYHVVIFQDGSLLEARPIDTIGAHCAGYNRVSIGVCLAGGRSEEARCVNAHDRCYGGAGSPCPYCEHRAEDNFTVQQRTTLRDYLRLIRGPLYGYAVPVKGHSELHRHQHGNCPCLDMKELREWIDN